MADAAATTAARFVEAGVPPTWLVGSRRATLALVALPAVALGGSNTISTPRRRAGSQFLLDDRLGLDRLRDRIAALPRADRWQTEARAALRDDFYESQHALTAACAHGDRRRRRAPEARVDAWLAEHGAAVGRYRDLVHDVERPTPPISRRSPSSAARCETSPTI